MLVSIEKNKLILKKWVNIVSALETEALRWPIRKNGGPVERLRPEPAFCSNAAEILPGPREDRAGWR